MSEQVLEQVRLKMKGDKNMPLRSKNPSRSRKGVIIHGHNLIFKTNVGDYMYGYFNRNRTKKANENLNLKLKAASKRCVSSEVRS